MPAWLHLKVAYTGTRDGVQARTALAAAGQQLQCLTALLHLAAFNHAQAEPPLLSPIKVPPWELSRAKQMTVQGGVKQTVCVHAPDLSASSVAWVLAQDGRRSPGCLPSHPPSS